jgi:hypothetical protein
MIKVFWFFFSKKNCLPLPCLGHPQCPIGIGRHGYASKLLAGSAAQANGLRTRQPMRRAGHGDAHQACDMEPGSGGKHRCRPRVVQFHAIAVAFMS